MKTAPFTVQAIRQACDLSRAVSTLLDIALKGRATERDLLALLALAGDHQHWVRDQVEIVLAGIEAEVDQAQDEDRGDFLPVGVSPIGGPFGGPRAVP